MQVIFDVVYWANNFFQQKHIFFILFLKLQGYISFSQLDKKI